MFTESSLRNRGVNPARRTAKFTRLLNDIGFGAIVYDDQGEIVYANRLATDFLGVSTNELRTQTIFDFIPAKALFELAGRSFEYRVPWVEDRTLTVSVKEFDVNMPRFKIVLLRPGRSLIREKSQGALSWSNFIDASQFEKRIEGMMRQYKEITFALAYVSDSEEQTSTELLTALARNLSPEDFIARVDKQHIAVVMPETTLRQGRRRIERLQRIAKFNAGIVSRMPRDTPQDILARARTALHYAVCEGNCKIKAGYYPKVSLEHQQSDVAA